jgi:hydroxymethylpyrimidine/phosphomethylpyrimidine kinase
MTRHRTPIALTIAGSDSSGGAGIQADLKTFSALGVYGASAITALTAQNTLGVDDVMAVPPEFVLAQMQAVAGDLDVGAIKIGMLATAGTVDAVATGLDLFDGVPVVLDPVMVATSGDLLLDEDAVGILRERLVPRATLITPNLAEGAALLGEPPESREQMMEGRAERLLALGPDAVLLTGGESIAETALDIFADAEGVQRIEAPRHETNNTHGTGCTLSSAIAAELAKGETVEKAVKLAKLYVTAAIIAADEIAVGQGAGPLHHFHALWAKPEKSPDRGRG